MAIKIEQNMKKYFYILAATLLFAACGDDGGEAPIDTPEETYTPSNVNFAEATVTEMESAGTVDIKVKFSRPAEKDFSFVIDVIGEYDMVEGTDYQIDSREIQVTKGDSVAIIPVKVTNDSDVNPDRYFELRISDAGEGQILEPSSCRVNFVDDESQAGVRFETKESDVYETDGKVRIPLKLEGTPSGTVHFRVEQTQGTAQEGVDYQWITQDLELNNTTDMAYVELEFLDDETSDPLQTLVLEVTEVTGGYALTSSGNTLVNLRDNEVTLSFGANAYTIAETDKLLHIPLYLSQPLTEDMEITLNVTGTATEEVDFTLEKTLSIAAGRDSAVVVLNVMNAKDTYNEDKKLTLSVAASDNDNVSASGSCDITILDCNTQLFFSATPTVRSNALTMDVNVVLEKPLKHDVTFKLVSNPVHFIETGKTYTIPAGSQSHKVTITKKQILPGEQFSLAMEDVHGATAFPEPRKVNVLWPLDKHSWSITFASANGTQTAKNLIDGGELTAWTNYDTRTGIAQVPCETIISLGEPTNVSYLELSKISDDSQTRGVEVYTTNSTEWQTATWSDPIKHSFHEAMMGGSMEHEWPYPQQITFIKIRIVDCAIDEETGAKIGQLAELTLY